MTPLIVKHLKPEQMEKLDLLIDAGFFDMESGKVEININNNQIQNVYTYKMVYKRNKGSM